MLCKTINGTVESITNFKENNQLYMNYKKAI